jgi:hypothetical protein
MNHVHPTTLQVEMNLAFFEGKNGVIPTQADSTPWKKFRSPLPDNDVAGDYVLAAEFFHTKSFADAIAAIFYAALSFFMSHKPEIE